MPIGNLTSKASPILSWFVISCCIVIAGLLYITQKAQAAADTIATNEQQGAMQEYLGL